ncbi:AAA family ATPase [Liberiplasma polymorphum]|uniref:AAA family ATPase n=1 Tax=Liberiplasma polymorphum TaxID=3374570 RepID=UPI0037743DCC
MIAHLFIKNFKAFKKTSIVLGEHTLLIGTHNSGKTTVLEVLDAFFNHRLDKDQIRNKSLDVVIECLIDDERYRKTFSPPHYTFNADLSIGDFTQIKALKYIYLPQQAKAFEATMNDFYNLTLAIPKTKEIDDFIKNYPLFYNKIHPVFQKEIQYFNLRLKEPLSHQQIKHYQTALLSDADKTHLIIGIDSVERNLDSDAWLSLIEGCSQSIITTKQKQLVDKYPHTITPLFKTTVKKEVDTYTKTVGKKFQKTFMLVEGKYDVPWFEKALRLLGKANDYRILPCGGFGNIQFVRAQLHKAGFKTITITDGDIFSGGYQLSKSIIELYADKDYVNQRFNTNFKEMPSDKHELFNQIKQKDDVVKKVLSSWAITRLELNHAFVKEIDEMITDYERKH